MINVKDYGALGDGVADDTAAVQSAIAAARDGAVVLFPSGIYLLSTVTFHSAVQLVGERATLQLCRDLGDFGNGMIFARRTDGWSIRNLTFDVAGKIGAAVRAISSSDWDVTDCRITGFQVGNGIISQSCERFRIQDNDFINPLPDPQTMNCAVLHTLGGDYSITGNRVQGSLIYFGGHDAQVVKNKVFGCDFGSAITARTDSERIIVGQNVVSGSRGKDANQCWIGGMEIYGRNHIVQGNIVHDNEGAGICIGATNTVVEGNLCYDNGFCITHSPDIRPGLSMRVMFDTSHNPDWDRSAIGSIVIGNRCFDSRGVDGTQGYGLAYQLPQLAPPGVFLGANNFKGNKYGEIKPQ